jgi:transcriptional regulator with XRE-family HTH domain
MQLLATMNSIFQVCFSPGCLCLTPELYRGNQRSFLFYGQLRIKTVFVNKNSKTKMKVVFSFSKNKKHSVGEKIRFSGEIFHPGFFITFILIKTQPKIMEIGHKLRAKRTEKKLSAEYVADAIGVDISTYRKYERDEVSISLEKLEKIALALKVPVSGLLPDSVIQNNDNQSGGIALAYQSTIQLSEKAVEKCEDQIKELKQDKAYLMEEVRNLKEEIKGLKKKYE